MRRSRFTEEQIVAALKEHEAGVSTSELCRRLGISQETLYRWKRKYGGLEVSSLSTDCWTKWTAASGWQTDCAGRRQAPPEVDTFRLSHELDQKRQVS